MFKGQIIELRPTKQQEQYLVQCCGVKRFVYNQGLEYRSKAKANRKDTYNCGFSLNRDLNAVINLNNLNPATGRSVGGVKPECLPELSKTVTCNSFNVDGKNFSEANNTELATERNVIVTKIRV